MRRDVWMMVVLDLDKFVADYRTDKTSAPAGFSKNWITGARCRTFPSTWQSDYETATRTPSRPTAPTC